MTAVFPVTDGAHGKREFLPGRLDEFAIANGHGLGEGPHHDPRDASELARAELYRMNLDACVRRVDEQDGFIMKL
jgi:hypothetical protein